MPILTQIAIAVISFALSYILSPKPSSAQATTTEEGDVDLPTVNEGVEIPVFFGVVWSSDSTVVWWGDLFIEEQEIES